jgi:hypothetical protein
MTGMEAAVYRIGWLDYGHHVFPVTGYRMCHQAKAAAQVI